MTPISYEQARTLIQDGDIISVLRREDKMSLLQKLITTWTKSPIFHTAIAIWLSTGHGEKRLFVVEAYDATRRITPLSVYQKHPFHVLAKPEHVKFELFSGSLVERVGTAEYSYVRAFISGVRQYLKLPNIVLATGEFCSELAAKVWKMGGMDITETGLNPAELERVLVHDYGVQYRCIIQP
jgi:hypothetical protein